MWNPFKKKKKTNVCQLVFDERTPDERRCTMNATEQNVAESLLDRQECPDCSSKMFYEGPSGGAATNYQCAGCGSMFNISPFTAERI